MNHGLPQYRYSKGRSSKKGSIDTHNHVSCFSNPPDVLAEDEVDDGDGTADEEAEWHPFVVQARVQTEDLLRQGPLDGLCIEVLVEEWKSKQGSHELR